MARRNYPEVLKLAARQNIKEREFWLEQLSGDIVKSSFPFDIKNTTAKEFIIESMEFRFPGRQEKELFSKLMELTKGSNYTLNLVLISMVTLLLSKYTGHRDILVGTPIHKQQSEGDFVNTVLVLRNRIESNKTFKEFILQVRQTIKEANENQNYPLEILIEELSGDTLGNSYLFDVAVLLENIHEKKYLGCVQCNVLFSLIKKEDCIMGVVEYNSALYTKSTIKQVITHFTNLFRNGLLNIDSPLFELEMIAQEEKSTILYDFNNTEKEYPKHKTVHQWFEDQVARTPNSIAVSAPVELKDIFQGASCFKKNPYMSQFDLEYFKEPFKLLKTHHHNCVVVNRNMLKLIESFNGQETIASIYSHLKDLKAIKFIIYIVEIGDLLEITHRFSQIPAIFSNMEYDDFILLVKMLYENQLIELATVRLDKNIGENERWTGFIPGELVYDKIALSDFFFQNRNYSHADVLLLGDSPGMPSTGLLYIASYLKRNGVKVLCRFYDSSVDYQSMKTDIESLLEQIHPGTVAISLKWFLYIARVIDMCKIIKEYSRRHGLDIKVVVGGNTASYYWEEVIKYDGIDYLVRGDGEEPLLKIVRGERNIPNCIYKENGKIIENPITYIQDEIDSSEIYLSHLEEILLDKFTSLLGVFFVYTQKGCAMNCLYCGGCNKTQQIAFNRKNILRRGVQEVRKDISEAKKYASTFHFEFDILDKNLAGYCREIWEGIDLSGHFCWFNTLTPPTTELVELVSRTFKYVYWDFDICTPSERHRKQLESLGLVKPQPSDAEIMDFFTKCEKFENIEVRPNLITGLPFFTSDDIEAGEKLLTEMMNTFSCFGELHWARLHAQPGAPVTSEAGKYHMHSYAANFEDFYRYSEKNFNRESLYATVENFNYPYIYFNDDRLNSRITNFYLEINKKIAQHTKEKERDSIVSNTLTYRQLDEKAGQLADLLKAKGSKPGHIVGLLLERSVSIPVGILAILKCGAAYLPIDPEFPAERIGYMLKDTNAVALITTRDLLKESNKTINWGGAKILLEDPAVLSATSVAKSPPEALNWSEGHPIHHSSFITHHSGNLAYVIYTSGTTGKPKGVAIKHENLVNYVYWFSNKVALTGKDKTILTASFAFDLGYTSLYNSILNGGELHILPREMYLMPERLLSYIKQKEITFLKVTPSLFTVIVNSPGFSGITCQSLRLVAMGGEPINVKDIERAHSLCRHLKIMNHYGPTETTIGCAATIIDFTKFEEYKTHPVIGKPIDNTELYILGKDLELLPVGVPGELCVSGAGVGRGYLNQPELTTEKFIMPSATRGYFRENLYRHPAPRGLDPVKLLFNYHSPFTIHLSPFYKTGDLARWLPNGTIEFLGRIDNQVKIRGYRIELGEIENRLSKHSKIESALVLLQEAPPGGKSDINGSGNSNKYLCAYIVPKKKGEIKGIETLKEKSKPEEFKEEYPNKIVDFIRGFQKTVKEKPFNIAVKSDHRELTYGLLDKYALRVAREILQKCDDTYSLSAKERQRYRRQMLLYGWGLESQEKLKSTTVFVAGAGGGGSPTIVQLALLGFGTIKICDFDEIELSNLNRQFLHNEQRIGMNKALSAQITVKQINPHVNVITYKEKLTRENVFELVGDSAVIFDMFDGPADKFILSECAVVKQIPHIIIAMADLNSYSAVFHTPHTPCYHCIFDQQKFETISAGMQQYVENYKKNPLAVAAPSLFTSTGTAVTEALKILLGFDRPAYNRFFYFNQRGAGGSLKYTPSYQSMTHLFSEHFREISKKQGLDWEEGWRGKFLEELDIEPNPDCPVCGTRGQEKRKALEERMKKAKPTSILVDVNEEMVIRTKDKSRDKKKTVALLFNHDIRLAVGITAALKSGKTCVPFDPLTPIDNLSEMLTDSEARIILTDNNHLSLAGKLKDKVNKNIKVIDVELSDEPGIPGESSPGEIHESEIEMDPEQEAYILNFPDADDNPGFNETIRELQCAMVKGNGPFVFTHHHYKQSPENEEDMLAAQLREYLADELPGYMIPSYFVQLEKIPMTPNGKVDKNALPTPAVGMGKGLHPVHKPRNEIEETLTQIWSEVLEIEKEKIGIDTNFFELGGHSLNAAIMVAKIHKELNVKLPLGKVFIVPTIRGLAEIAKTEKEDIYVLIRPIEEKEYYPMSSAQLRFFLLYQIKTDTTSDNVSGVFSLDGSLEVHRMEDVFNQLIKRHEVFRTSFEIVDHQPVQRVHRAVSFKIIHIEPGNVTSGLTDREIGNIIHNFIRPFDLNRAPLLRIGVLKLAEQKRLVVYDMHHIISDGTSFPIFVNEFISLYGGGQLPRLKIQYKDFTIWQKNLAESNAFKKQEEYWLDLFSTGVPDLKLPTDYPREASQNFEGDFVSFALDKNLAASIYKIADEVGATLYMALLGIYNILLYKYTGQEDIVVGSSAAGRPHADLQDVLGFFVNTLPMRNYPKGEKTFMEFLKEVKSNALKAYENQDFQFDELVKRLGIQRDASRQPLFDTHLTLHKIHVESNPDVKVEDLSFERYPFEDKTTQFDIIFHAFENGEGVHFSVGYSTKLFKKKTIEQFLDYYKEIAQITAENKSIKLKDIKISHHLEAAQANMPQADFVF